MTVEDPVEYELKGINQVAVKNDIGRSFPSVLRHFLRQDPDIIMVGEIRDGETADIAIQAANTGHLVFSTLHTNDASSAYTRLIDMGSEPFLVADAIEAVMAQRLIRTICPDCKTPHDYPREDLLKIAFPTDQLGEEAIFKGEGCDLCGQRGYRGRTGIYEMLTSTESIEKLVIDRASASVIAQQARADGMQTLRDDGWVKVLDGRTTVEEVLRVTQVAQTEEAVEA
jgi:type II secretory ATPase GspE/PulE/Tfp pilus assembly ATPase PilB-like protein